MNLLSVDTFPFSLAANMLQGFDCPAILVSPEYEILATNMLYREAFGDVDVRQQPKCYVVSHGYRVPCDKAGEDCPLLAAKASGHRERVLHIHQTPRGPEHVDVELIPLHGEDGQLRCFIELLRPVPLAGGDIDDKALVGRSAVFHRLLSDITRVARSSASVLLLGESGTGKELAARAIHLGSGRKNKALVTLECAGLTDALFESELFGHVKGAFTGAHTSKRGLVELADGGSLFLDEIGDIPLSMQVKLLRLIESGTFRQVGSAEVKRTDFRLICATHKDLVTLVEAGDFREDLFYRINVFPIQMPALDARKEDIPLIAKAILSRISPKKALHLTDAAAKRLEAHHYRGNIRELRNILQRAMLFTETNVIEEKTIEQALHIDRPLRKKNASDGEVLLDDLKSAEKRHLQMLMDAFNGDKARVAKTAGISVRSLYRKLEANIEAG